MEPGLSIVPQRAARPEGWELRLASAINAAFGRPYHARDWNCATFAHTCATAVRGVALPYRWRGGLSESVDAVLARVPVKFAQRGDVVIAHVPEPTLGVCVGAHALFVTPSGRLLEVPMGRALIAWVV